MFVPLDEIPSDHDLQIAQLSKKKSTKIWIVTE